MGDGAAERRGQSDYGRDIIWPLAGNRAGDNAAQAVANDVDLALRFHERSFDNLVELALDQDVRTICIESDAGKIGAVPDACEPGTQLRQVSVGTQEPGNEDDRRPVTTRHTQAVVNRRSMQQKKLRTE